MKALTQQTNAPIKQYHFYTYFDENYLCRGLALYQSMQQWIKDFRLYVLCLDDMSFELIKKLDITEIEPIQISKLENYDPELLSKKHQRTKIEYYFTCTSCAARYIFDHFQAVDYLTYLDADTFFFSDPTDILEELQSYSIAITPHRFSESKKSHEKYGLYNVGWVSFKRDRNGLACVSRWREDCLEWCGAYLDDGRYGDQKYLDQWPALFENVKIINHFGVNAGPWNLDSAKFAYRDGMIYINDQPLVLYHFHNLSRLSNYCYRLGLHEYSINICSIIKNKIYSSYIKQVRAVFSSLLNLSRSLTIPRYGMLKREFSYRHYLACQDLLWTF